MSFTENLYLKRQLQQLQEENQKLKNILLEYEADYMADVDLPPFDPKNPNKRSRSGGSMAADALHQMATQLHAEGKLPGPLPHPIELSPAQLEGYTVHMMSALPPDMHKTLHGLVDELLLQHPKANLALQDFGGVRNQTGEADPTKSAIYNHALMRDIGWEGKRRQPG